MIMSVNDPEIDNDSDSEEEREKEADFFQAIRKGKLHEVQAFLKSGMKINIIDRNNRNNTPLHVAVEKCKREIVEEFLLRDCKTNINAQNSNGDTSLHIAVSKGQKELVNLLLNKHADTSIRNNKLKTPSELAQNQEIIDILAASAQPQAQTSGVHASNQQMLPMKRKESDDDDSPTKRPRISLEKRRPIDEEGESDNEETKKLKTSAEYQASGLKLSLHGVSYQLKLLMLCLKRGVDQGYSFRLATEMDAAEKFDDLVFQYREGNKIVHRFLQAKHKQDGSKNISINDLLTQTDGNFSLQKYFISYRKIKQNPEFNGTNNEIGDLIICTNIGFKFGDRRKALTLSNDIFVAEKDKSILKTNLLRFTKDFVGKEEIVSILKNVPDLIKLARKLLDCVLGGESLEKIKSKKDASSDLFKSYQFALVREVIDSHSKKLRPEFVTNANNLSPNAKRFREAFEAAFHGRRKMYNLDSNPFVRVGELEKFAQEVAALIQAAGSSGEIRVEKRKTVIKNNFDKLAGYVLVKKDGKTRFSSAFLNGNKLPGNLDSFRKTLLGELSKQKIMFNKLALCSFKIYKDFKTCEEIFVDIDTFWESIKEKELNLFDNFGKSDANLESVHEFVANLVHLIQESRNKDEEEIEIEGEDTIFTKNMIKLAKHALVEKNGRIYFSHEFLNDSSLPDNLNEFRAKLKPQVDELGDVRFVIKNFPRSSLPSDSIADIDTDIQSFLDKLVFAVNQSNEIELDQRIIAEMGDCKDINVIDSEFLAGSFGKFILDWLKEKKGRFLTCIDGKKFFNEMKMKLASLKLTGLTLEYRSKMEQTNVRFANDEIELKQFVEPENTMQLFILQSIPDTILGLIQVYQTLENIPEYKNGNGYIFIRLHSFLRMRDFIAEAFGSQRKHLLIIKCETVQDSERDSDRERELIEVIKSNDMRKIILITDDNNMLVKILKWMYSDRYVEKKIEVSSLLDLDRESRSKIMEGRKIKFQGQDVSLSDLINEESMNLIDAAALTKLINNTTLKIAEPLQNLGDVSSYYIPRTLKRWEKINRSFEHDKLRFYVSPNGRVNDPHLLQNKDIVLISENNKFFKDLSNEKEYKRYNIHWLKLKNGEYKWQASNGALTKIRELVDERKESATTYTPTKVNDIMNKVVIIAAEPGMGKSTVLTHLALKTKASEPTVWVARINLSVDSSKELSRRVQRGIRFNDEEFIDFLLKSMKSKPGLDQEFLKYCYKKGRLVLLLDGFDEISPFYTGKVIELLKFLKDTKVDKIWVTTRPYNIKNDLEDELGLFSHALEKFSNEDQRRFLKKFWTANAELDNFDESRAEIFIDELLNRFSELINDCDRKFISIPLQIRMVADIFKDNFVEFCESVDTDLPSDRKRRFEKQLNLIGLYRNFFEIKFDHIRFGEKKPEWNEADADIKEIQNNNRKDDIKNHEELALFNLYGDSWVNKLIPDTDVNKLLTYVKQCKNKTGIIDRVVDNIPVFVHQSFAEYFAALWLNEKLLDKKKKNIVVEFLMEHIFQDESKVVRHFFDRMLTESDKSDDKYEIHIQVLNNDVDKVEKLLDLDPSVLDTLDRTGRTPLHSAAAYGYVKITQNLLRVAKERGHSNTVSVKDELFNWSPISYADRNGHWAVVELLLQNGADGDDMFEAERNAEMLLHLAARQGHLEIIKYLVDKKNGNFEHADSRGETPLHHAAYGNHLDIIKYLVDEKNADFNAVDHEGAAPLHYAAMKGHLRIVQYLVDEKNVNFYAVDVNGETPLHHAANEGHLEIIKYLVDEKNANFEVVDNRAETPLHHAADEGHLEIIKYLVNEKDAEFEAVNAEGNTILHIATQWGHLEIIKYLVDEKHANFNAVDTNEKTPLYYAVQRGNLEIVKYLVDAKNADIDAVDARGKTIMHYASEMGDLGIMKYLIGEKNANFNVVDEVGNTPLHYAVQCGDLKVIEYLVDEKNANFDAVNVDGKTPLHYVAERGYLEIIKYLVNEKNANLNAVDKEGNTALHYAVDKGHLKIIKYLVEEKNVNSDTIEARGNMLLQHAAQWGNLEMIKYLVNEKHTNLDFVNSSGETLLHHSARWGKLEVIKYLVDEKNANCDVVNVDGETPLHIAAQRDHLEIMKYFIDEKEANYNALNAEGNTPLHYAFRQGSLSTIDYLTNEKKINLDAVDAEGNTPLHWAALWGNIEIIKYLIDEKNANFNAINAEGNTLLHNASQKGYSDIIKYLVDEKKANSNPVNTAGMTPLHYASLCGNLDIIKYLVDEKNANLEAVDAEGSTPLHYAVLSCNPELIKYLADEKHANFDVVDRDGLTPLHWATLGGHLEIIKHLVDEKNTNCNVFNANENVLLHCAADEGHLEIFKYLVDEKNANFNAIDAEGNMPLHNASLGGHIDIVKYLIDKKNVDCDRVNRAGKTPLHYASLGGHLNIVKYLVDDKKADFESLDAERNTPLHHAVLRYNPEIIKYTVDEKNADIDAVKARATTTTHLSTQGEHLEVIRYLVDEKNANFNAVNANGNTLLHYAAEQGNLDMIVYLVGEKNASFDSVDAEGNTPLHYATQQGHLEIVNYLNNKKNAKS